MSLLYAGEQQCKHETVHYTNDVNNATWNAYTIDAFLEQLVYIT